MKKIIDKYLDGKSTEEDEILLYSWLKKDQKNLDFFKERVLSKGLAEDDSLNFDSAAAFKAFKNRLKPREISISRFKGREYFKYAAVSLILLSSSFLIFFIANGGSKLPTEALKTVKSGTGVQKNQDRIIITNTDGLVQVIDEEKEELSYLSRGVVENEVTFNTINVPKGKVFRLVLSDSTVVWLNAETELIYPTRFDEMSKNRSVVVQGEAFFDVSHNPDRPFIVTTENIEIEVLGTKFNVSSYPKEEQINTTLIEGSVKVTDQDAESNSVVMVPSHQASFDKAAMTLTSKEVDTHKYTAWMQKKIIFDNTPFAILLDKIERTYNVEVENQNSDINSERFTGEFDTEDNIEVIFKALSTSRYFEYVVEQNKVTILKP